MGSQLVGVMAVTKDAYWVEMKVGMMVWLLVEMTEQKRAAQMVALMDYL
jgi:hypothetical protein